MDYLNAKSRGGQTPLHVASMCGKDEVIVKLLALGANINARDYYGKGLLSWWSLRKIESSTTIISTDPGAPESDNLPYSANLVRRKSFNLQENYVEAKFLFLTVSVDESNACACLSEWVRVKITIGLLIFSSGYPYGALFPKNQFFRVPYFSSEKFAPHCWFFFSLWYIGFLFFYLQINSSMHLLWSFLKYCRTPKIPGN